MPSSEAFSAPTASRPAFVTCATPLLVGRDGGRYRTDCCFGKAEYFFKRDWTTQITLIRLKKLAFARTSARRQGTSAGRMKQRVGRGSTLDAMSAKARQIN